MQKRISAKILVAAAFLFCPNVWAELPIGSYQGQGAWHNDIGRSGDYKVEVLVEEKSIQTIYNDYSREYSRNFLIEGPIESFTLQSGFIQNGFGYCIDNICQLTWFEGEDQLSETWIISEAGMLRRGQRRYENHWSIWSETLDKQ